MCCGQLKRVIFMKEEITLWTTPDKREGVVVALDMFGYGRGVGDARQMPYFADKLYNQVTIRVSDDVMVVAASHTLNGPDSQARFDAFSDYMRSVAGEITYK